MKVVGNYRFLNQGLEKLTPDPKSLTNFRTGALSGRLLCLLRFIQQVPINLIFTNRPRMFFLIFLQWLLLFAFIFTLTYPRFVSGFVHSLPPFPLQRPLNLALCAPCFYSVARFHPQPQVVSIHLVREAVRDRSRDVGRILCNLDGSERLYSPTRKGGEDHRATF